MNLWSGDGRRPGWSPATRSGAGTTSGSRSPTGPGVIAAIARVLGDHGISIASLIQHDPGDDAPPDAPVPLVMMTHLAVEAHLRAALARDRPPRRGPRPERLPGGRGVVSRPGRSPLNPGAGDR